jgi:glucose-fructose oxidoreductase
MWLGKDGREREVDSPAGPGKTQFAGQLDHLVECVRTGREPIVSGEEGLRDMRIVEAIYRSAREGRTIRLDGRA